jgi:predicted NAD/FAD-binding protein
MKIAVIGAGVAGLGAAWLLSRRHDVVVYERESRFGGHSCTVDAPTPGGPTPGGRQPVDVGFIVFNERNYPNLIALFEHLGVPTEASNMSFAVSLDEGRFEYGSSSAGYFAQRSNLVRPSFLRMTHDILRFNRLAPRLLQRCEDLDFTIGDFCDHAGLGSAFRDRYLVPMAACIWSTPLGRMLDYPAQTFVRFCHNHGLLTVGPQLAWRTVRGGSRSYVERIAAPLRQRARLATPASAVRRGTDGVQVRDATGHWDRFDKVIMACHADHRAADCQHADLHPGRPPPAGAGRTADDRSFDKKDVEGLPAGKDFLDDRQVRFAVTKVGGPQSEAIHHGLIERGNVQIADNFLCQDCAKHRRRDRYRLCRQWPNLLQHDLEGVRNA